MLKYLGKRPMLIAAVGCSVSAVCGYYFKGMVWIILGLCVLFLALALVKQRANSIIALGLICIMCISGLNTLKEIKSQNSLTGKSVRVQFIFCQTSFKGEQAYNSLIEIVSCEELKKGTKISVWHSPSSLESGDMAIGTVKLSGHSAEYKAINYGLGVYLSGSLKEITPLNNKDWALSLGDKIRSHIRKEFFSNMSFKSASTMCALVFGDMDYFTDGFYENVKAAGVAHIMVVSGMHLSILVSLILKLTERLFYNPYFRALIMLFVVLLVCGVCGFTMSILRASVTYVIMALGLVLNRPYSGENALGLAVVIILISSPFAILNVAFQLSVLSTFGILAVALPVCDYIKSRFFLNASFLYGIMENIIMTVAALILTLPVTIYVFGYVSNLAVISNLLVSTPVNICLCLSVMSLIIGFFCPPVAAFGYYISDLIMRYVNFVINELGSKSYAVTKTDESLCYPAILIIFSVFYLLSACKKRIDVLKLKQINLKVISERGGAFKWQSFLKKP